MDTRANENNMFTEKKKKHICFKNIIVSEHGLEHVTYVTGYIFGEVTEEENKRNGGRRQILKSFILLWYGQKGEM